MVNSFEFHMPTKVFFGKGIIREIGEKAKALGKRVLLVTGSMGKNSGALQVVDDLLKKMGLECIIFDEVEAQPREKTIERGGELVKDQQCELVVGIGGECPMEAAKIIAMLATNSFSLSHYFGENKVENQPLPIIAVPLTAGSGSEVAPFSAVTVENEFIDIKIIHSPLLYPMMAFVDPEFTLSFPSPVTINNGIDALVHAIEAIVSKKSQPLTDILAIKSIRSVCEYLTRTLDEPQNINFRSKLSYASLLSGIAIGQTGLGLVHQMGYPLTLVMGLAHGKANGLLLPGVCKGILNQAHHRLEAVAKGLGVETAESNEAELVEKILLKIQTLISQVGLVPEIESKSIIEEKISDFADRVKSHLGSEWNLSREGIKEIYKEALIQK